MEKLSSIHHVVLKIILSAYTRTFKLLVYIHSLRLKKTVVGLNPAPEFT